MYTVEQTIRQLEEVVRQRGKDYVDPLSMTEFVTCKYTYEHHGETRHCIAGQVAKNQGFIEEIDSQGESVIVLPAFCSRYDIDSLKALKAAQDAQDSGSNWGEALEKAKLTAPG